MALKPDRFKYQPNFYLLNHFGHIGIAFFITVKIGIAFNRIGFEFEKSNIIIAVFLLCFYWFFIERPQKGDPIDTFEDLLFVGSGIYYGYLFLEMSHYQADHAVSLNAIWLLVGYYSRVRARRRYIAQGKEPPIDYF